MFNKLLLIALILLTFSFISRNQNTIIVPFPTPQITLALIPTPTHKPGDVYVLRVIDGDTIVLNTGEKVRYIGVNTPEISDNKNKVECFAVDAYNANKSLVEGKIVRLEKDISNTDKYDRLLRYVYVADPSYVSTPGGQIKELFVNDYLVKYGYAQVATYPPDVKFYKQLLNSQTEARSSLLGIWKTCKK